MQRRLKLIQLDSNLWIVSGKWEVAWTILAGWSISAPTDARRVKDAFFPRIILSYLVLILIVLTGTSETRVLDFGM